MTDVTDLVTITQVEPAGPSLRIHLYGEAQLSGGGAQWEVIDRPRRRAATEWVGSTAHRLKVPLLFDGMDLLSDGVDRSVEAECALLAAWWQPAKPNTAPPILSLAGSLTLPPYELRWVIDDLEWGPAFRGPDRARLQQEVAVTFLEHTTAAILFGPAAAARARAGL